MAATALLTDWRDLTGSGDADAYKGPGRLGRTRLLAGPAARARAAVSAGISCPLRSTTFLDASYGIGGLTLTDLLPYAGVAGYVSPNPGKNISRRLCHDVVASGRGVLIFWQAGGRGPMGGAPQGRMDAAEANAQADQLGWPLWCGIRYAVDFPPSTTELWVVAEYFRALVGSSRRPVRAYGSDEVLDYLALHVGVLGDVQPVAWSGGRISRYAAARQMAGAPCWGYPRGIAVDEEHLLPGRRLEWWHRDLEPPKPPTYGHLAAPAVGGAWCP